jgi:MFS transporter, DHA1 family, multidrug resistance protein
VLKVGHRVYVINMSQVQGPHWQRTLWAMCAVQFILSSSFTIVPSVIPLLLSNIGVHEPGAVRIWAGAVIGVTPLAAALMSPAWGRLSDRVDRRIIILISCSTAAVCTALMSFVANPSQLLGLRFCMGLFGGHIAAGLAIVCAAVPTARLGYALGWMATAQLSGSLLGPLIGGSVADAFGNLRAPFFGSGFATLLVAGAIVFVPRQPRSAGASDLAQQAGSTAMLSRYPKLRTLVVVLLLAQCAIMSPQPMVSLFVLQLVGQRADLATLAGFAFSIVAFSGAIGSLVLGRLSDAIGTRRVLLGCVLAAAVCILPQGFSPHYSWFVAERFLGGLFLAGIIPTVNALIGKSVPDADHGRTYGIMSSATFFGAFIGPLGGGALAAALGLRSVFIGSASLLLITALWIETRLDRE